HLTGTDALGDPCECEGSDDKSDQKEVPGVILEKTPQAFIPKGGAESNEVTITAKAVGGVKGTFKFTLYDVSSLGGHAMNAPLQDRDPGKDLKFPKPQDGFTVTGDNNDVAETTANDLTEAKVKVKAFDYGAYGKIKVTLTTTDGKKTYDGIEKGSKDKKYTNVPLDDNDNHIADGAPQDTGPGKSSDAKDDNDDNPKLDGEDGDRLTRFEEYRGFFVAGKHLRTSPKDKDLFVSNQTGYEPKDGNGSTLSLLGKTGLAVHEVTKDEYNGKREINFNGRDDIAGAKAQRAVVGEKQDNHAD